MEQSLPSTAAHTTSASCDCPSSSPLSATAWGGSKRWSSTLSNISPTCSRHFDLRQPFTALTAGQIGTTVQPDDTGDLVGWHVAHPQRPHRPPTRRPPPRSPP